MSLYSMPFLILNYGAEMMFVLQTRFVAQKVDEKTSSTVINEFSQLLFNTSFVEELFRPQVMYSYLATKELFSSVAQSTIMRLSLTSLNKLFDLMTMAMKYEFVTLRHPLELVEMTFQHLEELQRVLTPTAEEHLIPVFDRLRALCARLLPGDLASIRHQILNLLSVRNISVSVLVESGRQASDGSFVIPRDAHLPPCVDCEAPGVIRYHTTRGLSRTDTFPHRDASLMYPQRTTPGSWDPLNPNTRLTRNGMNMYAQSESLTHHEREMPKASAAVSVAAAMATSPRPALSSIRAETLHALTGELGYLSQLVLGSHVSSGRREQEPFRLILFDHEEGGTEETDATQEASRQPQRSDAQIPVCSMSRTEVEAQNKELMRIAQEIQIGKSVRQSKSNPGDDLLDIMDEI